MMIPPVATDTAAATARRTPRSRLTAMRRAAARIVPTGITPVQASAFQPAAAQTPGLLSRLWPTDRPVYKRPAAIGGLLLVVGIVGYLYLLGGEEGTEGAAPEERPLPALPPAE